ncbi:DUF805 domain-containing protein [Prevotella sp. OH937_COT-195]|uniref:DUF805 domain-containing protein n=1 Tax=Prevotella sp. OH937_COT-195 TaxID=2491051 RepID=UPI000F645E79|nr:DUF805 domain-containing protein [Prevotella sp. OH937_COT-195]RRD00291.1 DUF805 domain-containing protein [Prevotella sp. OH937_COT-195]
MKWFIKTFRQYADFSGRATRQEFWIFVLFNLLFTMIWAVVAGLITLLLDGFLNDYIYKMIFMNKLTVLYYAVMAVPSMAVGIRRLHDTGRSGWWMLVGLIPFVGGIWLLVLMCLEGNAYDNRYGIRPDESTENVPKPALRQKALMWLTSFSVFGICLCLFDFFKLFIFPNYGDTGRLDMLLSVTINFFISISFIIMGIAFLQKRNYFRVVGGWIVFAHVLWLVLAIWQIMQIIDFRINIEYVLHIMTLLAFVLYGVLLLAGKGRFSLTNYVLIGASGFTIVSELLSMMSLYYFLKDSPGFFISQILFNQLLDLIVPLLLLLYAIGNLTAAEKDTKYKSQI